MVLAAVIQTTLLPHWRLLSGSLDLTLLLVLGWTLAGDWQGGMVWSLMGGLCLDILSGAPLGTTTVGLVLVAYGTSLTEGRLWRSHILLPLASSLTGTLGVQLVAMLFLLSNGQPLDVGSIFWRIVLPTALLNTAGILPVYQAMRWLQSVVYPETVTI
jgi:rod shape-determining protein MreD